MSKATGIGSEINILCYQIGGKENTVQIQRNEYLTITMMGG
jgi:hypothetical protein